MIEYNLVVTIGKPLTLSLLINQRCRRVFVLIPTSAQNVGVFFLALEYLTLYAVPAAPSRSLSQVNAMSQFIRVEQ